MSISHLRPVVLVALLGPLAAVAAPAQTGTTSPFAPSGLIAHEPHPCHRDSQPTGHGPTSGDERIDCTTGQERKNQV